MNLTCAVPEVNRAKRFAPLLLRMRSRRRSEKIDSLMGICDFENESRIVPSTEGLLCRHVNCTFTFWTGHGNCQIRFSGCAVNVCVSGDEKSLCDRRTQRLNHRRMGLGPCQRVFVNVRRFYCAEHDHDH